jgi:hypothetical protein
MNLTLYSIQAFIILDTEGHRVLAKYYPDKTGEGQDGMCIGVENLAKVC